MNNQFNQNQFSINNSQNNSQSKTQLGTQTNQPNQFWLELETIKNNLEKVSCKVNGIHYNGFLFSKETKDSNGNLRPIKLAKMKECTWNNCSYCGDFVFV